MSDETPCSVMFDAFKDFGGISYKDLAYIILTDKNLFGGKSPRSRIDDKTWLSRYVVRAKYGVLPAEYFVDFGTGARKIIAELKSSSKAGLSNGEIFDFFTGPGAADMADALEEAHQDRALYENFVKRITALDTASDADRIDLLVLHYLTVGCTGDPAVATENTLQFATNTLGMKLKTSLPSRAEIPDQAPTEATAWALTRVVGNMIKGHPYILDSGPEGNEIGSLCTSAHAINDVEPTVSGRHLRIWRDASGCWLAEGLGSKNGTVLISGADNSVTIVEPPRTERDGFVSRPVEIAPSDRLILGQDTVFMVIQTV